MSLFKKLLDSARPRSSAKHLISGKLYKLSLARPVGDLDGIKKVTLYPSDDILLHLETTRRTTSQFKTYECCWFLDKLGKKIRFEFDITCFTTDEWDKNRQRGYRHTFELIETL